MTPEELDALMDGLTWEAYLGVLDPDECELDAYLSAARAGLVRGAGDLSNVRVDTTDLGDAVVARLRELAVCAHCGSPSVCIGEYEECTDVAAGACDTCCGHGNEDGWCKHHEDWPKDRAVAEVARG